MLLIDASQIHLGGALTLLEYLLQCLRKLNIDYIIIIDCRCKSNIVLNSNNKYYSNSPLDRKILFQRVLKENKINSVLCFNSFSPPFRLDGLKVVTYFHNPNLLSKANFEKATTKYKVVQYFKRYYLKKKLKNSDFYVFQNELVQDMFTKEYNYPITKTYILPFYDDNLINEIESIKLKKIYNRFCYISIPYSHKNHDILLNVWESLLKDKVVPDLVLTIPEEYTILIDKIQNLNQAGANIINLGKTDHRTALIETAKSEFCIYPSLSESLGLGLVEAQKLGCKIIASRLPYVNQVVNPSLYFNPNDQTEIKNTVLNAINHNKFSKETTLLMENEVFKLLSILSN